MQRFLALLTLSLASLYATGCLESQTTNTNANAGIDPSPAGSASPSATPYAQNTNMATGGSSEIPDFPFPPPRASALAEIPSDFLRTPNASTSLRDVSRKLRTALDDAGYAQTSLYEVPNGFALVSQLERFNRDGTVFGDAGERWAVQASTPRIRSFRDYLSALFDAPRGHYRVIAFVVTDRPLTQSEKTLAREDAGKLVQGGVNRLPPALGEIEFTDDFACTALVYEYLRTGSSRQPAIFVDPSRLTGREHIERSGILAMLRR